MNLALGWVDKREELGKVQSRRGQFIEFLDNVRVGMVVVYHWQSCEANFVFVQLLNIFHI